MTVNRLIYLNEILNDFITVALIMKGHAILFLIFNFCFQSLTLFFILRQTSTFILKLRVLLQTLTLFQNFYLYSQTLSFLFKLQF